MLTYNYNAYSELYHHGVKGQKWGVRNYQNEDGTLKEAAYSHYGYSHGEKSKSKKTSSNGQLSKKQIDKLGRMLTYEKISAVTNPISLLSKNERKLLKTSNKDFKKVLKNDKKLQKSSAEYLEKRKKRIKKALAVGAGLAITAGAAKVYALSGSTFIGDHIKNEKLKQKLTSFSYSPAAKKIGYLTKKHGAKVAGAGLTYYAIGGDQKHLQEISNAVPNKQKRKKNK